MNLCPDISPKFRLWSECRVTTITYTESLFKVACVASGCLKKLRVPIIFDYSLTCPSLPVWRLGLGTQGFWPSSRISSTNDGTAEQQSVVRELELRHNVLLLPIRLHERFADAHGGINNFDDSGGWINRSSSKVKIFIFKSDFRPKGSVLHTHTIFFCLTS